MLSSPYLSVLSYALVSIRSRPFSFFGKRHYPSLSHLPHSLPLSDLSTYDPLYLLASFTREDPLVRLCHCFHYLLLLLLLLLLLFLLFLLLFLLLLLLLFLLFFFNVEPSRQRPGDSSLERSWHSLEAACSSGKVALGAYNVRCKTD